MTDAYLSVSNGNDVSCSKGAYWLSQRTVLIRQRQQSAVCAQIRQVVSNFRFRLVDLAPDVEQTVAHDACASSITIEEGGAIGGIGRICAQRVRSVRSQTKINVS